MSREIDACETEPVEDRRQPVEEIARGPRRPAHAGTADVADEVERVNPACSGEDATPGWLAGHLGLNSASTTALIDRLQAKGLVSRARSDTDRRKVALQVTEVAREMGWSFFGPLSSR